MLGTVWDYVFGHDIIIETCKRVFPQMILLHNTNQNTGKCSIMFTARKVWTFFFFIMYHLYGVQSYNLFYIEMAN
jgi:hypothetical protein